MSFLFICTKLFFSMQTLKIPMLLNTSSFGNFNNWFLQRRWKLRFLEWTSTTFFGHEKIKQMHQAEPLNTFLWPTHRLLIIFFEILFDMIKGKYWWVRWKWKLFWYFFSFLHGNGLCIKILEKNNSEDIKMQRGHQGP